MYYTHQKRNATLLVFILLISTIFITCDDTEREEVSSTAGQIVARSGKKSNAKTSNSEGAIVAINSNKKSHTGLAQLTLSEEKSKDKKQVTVRKKKCQKGFGSWGKALLAVPYAIAEVIMVVVAILYLVLSFVGFVIALLFAGFTLLFGGSETSAKLWHLSIEIIMQGMRLFQVIEDLHVWYAGNCGL